MLALSFFFGVMLVLCSHSHLYLPHVIAACGAFEVFYTKQLNRVKQYDNHTGKICKNTVNLTRILEEKLEASRKRGALQAM